jgi:hypothetical protein
VTVDLARLRDHVGPGPSDEELEAVLDAAIEALDDRYGPDSATVTEYLRPFGQWVKLTRRASAVTSVLEGGEAVASGDREIWPGGRYLRRLRENETAAWTGMVEVEYTPFSEEAGRDRIVLALCDLDLTKGGKYGVTSITNGPWVEEYASPADVPYDELRNTILGSLRYRGAGVH